MEKQNSIAEKQNQPEFIRLLRAKSAAYDTADHYQTFELIAIIVGIIVPFLTFFFKDFDFKFILFGWGIVTFGLSFILDGRRKHFAGLGAKIQQTFDERLFGLKLNSNLSEEEISRLSRKYNKSENRITNWYSSMITPEVNQNSAILLCQRSNLYWTIGLRKKLIMLFVWIGIVYYVAILMTGCVTNMLLIPFLMSFVVPSFTMIKFIVKQYDKQTELVGQCNTQLEKINTVLNNYLKNSIEPGIEELTAIQQEIFNIRQKPEVLPYWLYNRTKKMYQQITDESAKEYVKQILEVQNK